MQAELWKKIEPLCHAALALPPAQRAAFLAQACPDDPEVRSEVESLLHQQAESFLEGSPVSSTPGHSRSEFSLDRTIDQTLESAPTPGDQIGPYRLLEVVGEGGMGQVWLAEQRQAIFRRVAVKLIKIGMDTREVIARFASERQALALMDHPAIAKVFDAGSTLQGRPYFVMEYVAGIPITAYCDQHLLTIRQRLELFMLVCEGVQHAHQKAMIHRDLKPSNILVCEVDGRPQPRIIDFGVSKAISQRLSTQTMYTRVGAIVGTMGYMSPEQADVTSEDVDTRSDVYSLGVVLYELLVGARPFDFQRVSFDEALRRLREDDAPKPSTKLRALGLPATGTALKRGLDAATLVRQLRGDADAIVLKALDKDRARRYATPCDLAADLTRFLRHEPVAAHAPSLGYRARKYVRRHRLAVIGTAAFVLVLLAAAAVSIRQSVRANREAAVAKAVDEFLRNDLLAQAGASAQSGPAAKPDPHLEVRTALDRAAARVAGKFDRQPEVEAAIRETIGRTYMDLGLYPEAQIQLERALELLRQAAGANDPETLESMSRLAHLALLQGKYPNAEALLKKTLELQRRALGPDCPDALASMHSLATAYEREGKYAEAESLFSQIVEVRRRVLGPEDRETLASMNGLAVTLGEQGKYPQVEALLSQLLEIDRRVLGPEHPDTLRTVDNLANAYAGEGKYAQAEKPYRQASEIKRRVLGPDHPDTLRSMGNLALDLEAEGKYPQAAAIQRELLQTSRRVLGPEHPDTLIALGNLADTNAQLGNYPDAEKLFGRTLEAERRVLGPDHPNTLQTLAAFASLFQRQGSYALAERYAAQALAGRRRALGSGNPDTMTSAADLALAFVSQRNFAESEPLAREALDFNAKNLPDDWQRFRDETLLGASLAGQKKYKEAEPLLQAGYLGMVAHKDRIDAPDWYQLQRAREWILRLYLDWDKPEKAAAWRAR